MAVDWDEEKIVSCQIYLSQPAKAGIYNDDSASSSSYFAACGFMLILFSFGWRGNDENPEIGYKLAHVATANTSNDNSLRDITLNVCLSSMLE